MGGLESLLSKVCNSLDPESIARYGNEGSLETPATRETLLTAIEVWQLAAELSVEEPLGTREVGAVQQWLKTKGMQEEVAETSSIREHSESDKSVLENQITTLKGDLHTVARLRDVKAIRGEEAFVEKIWADKALRHQLLKLWKPMRQGRSEEHTSELQSPDHLVCRLLLEKKNTRHTSPSARRFFTNRRGICRRQCRAAERDRAVSCQSTDCEGFGGDLWRLCKDQFTDPG